MGTGRALRGRKLVERAIGWQFPDSVLGRDEAERRTLSRKGALFGRCRSAPLGSLPQRPGFIDFRAPLLRFR
jgi:hypothetical protein